MGNFYGNISLAMGNFYGSVSLAMGNFYGIVLLAMDYFYGNISLSVGNFSAEFVICNFLSRISLAEGTFFSSHSFVIGN